MGQLLDLPSEIILYIFRFLAPIHIVSLQHVCTKLLRLGRDHTFWREQCFYDSTYLDTLARRRTLITSEPIQDARYQHVVEALSTNNAFGVSQLGRATHPHARSERVRILANWDPSFTNEKVDWYEEYIARYGPIQISWLPQPCMIASLGQEVVEARGAAVYAPLGSDSATCAIAPCDDGSICLWSLTEEAGRKGRVIGRSHRGMLGTPGQTNSYFINPGVTESISVDATCGKAYVACSSRLVEVDLETLKPVAEEKFPFSITALSETRHPTPLTVGTNLSLHLYDPRTTRHQCQETGFIDTVEYFNDASRIVDRSSSLHGLYNPISLSPYAHLHQPGPLHIVHVPNSTANPHDTSQIYVAGRFSSILNYDRRSFPRLKGTLYSGAQLCCLATLPYAVASMENDLARRGELSVEQLNGYKARGGSTLLACGEYRSKGSLEMYGLGPESVQYQDGRQDSLGDSQTSMLKNRQTSSNSKLLSVSTHGTKIVFSDGGGILKWFERDGFTEVRRVDLKGSRQGSTNIFGTERDDTGSGDIARKILRSKVDGPSSGSLNKEDLVLWTGERVGLVSFSSKPGFTSDNLEGFEQSAEEALRAKEEKTYADAMRQALEGQAHEVRYVQGLGLGLEAGS